MLADIQRYMDELSMTQVPDIAPSGASVFLFQQVCYNILYDDVNYFYLP